MARRRGIPCARACPGAQSPLRARLRRAPAESATIDGAAIHGPIAAAAGPRRRRAGARVPARPRRRAATTRATSRRAPARRRRGAGATDHMSHRACRDRQVITIAPPRSAGDPPRSRVRVRRRPARARRARADRMVAGPRRPPRLAHPLHAHGDLQLPGGPVSRSPARHSSRSRVALRRITAGPRARACGPVTLQPILKKLSLLPSRSRK